MCMVGHQILRKGCILITHLQFGVIRSLNFDLSTNLVIVIKLMNSNLSTLMCFANLVIWCIVPTV